MAGCDLKRWWAYFSGCLFGVILYIGDIGSDIQLCITLYNKCHYYWAALSATFICLPGVMFFLALLAKSFGFERTPQQRLKALGISALSGILFPIFMLYNSVQLMWTYSKPSNTKYESRLQVLGLFEMMCEALPQSILGWFILYYVDLGDSYILFVNATVFSLTTSTISLVFGVFKWNKFILSRNEKRDISLVKIVEGLIQTLIVPIEVVLFYSLTLQRFRGFALLMPLMIMISSFVVSLVCTEADIFTAVADSVLAILRSSTTRDKRANVIGNYCRIAAHSVFAVLNFIIYFVQSDMFLPPVVLTYISVNNSTLSAIREPEVIERLLNKTQNLKICQNICGGLPEACQEYYQIQFTSSTASSVRFWFYAVFYTIAFTMGICIICGIYRPKYINPENRLDTILSTQKQLKKKIHCLENNDENDIEISSFIIELEIDVQIFLDNPTASLPVKERLVRLLMVQDIKISNKIKKLFNILETDSIRIDQRLGFIERNHYPTWLKCISSFRLREARCIKKRLEDIEGMQMERSRIPLLVLALNRRLSHLEGSFCRRPKEQKRIQERLTRLGWGSREEIPLLPGTLEITNTEQAENTILIPPYLSNTDMEIRNNGQDTPDPKTAGFSNIEEKFQNNVLENQGLSNTGEEDQNTSPGPQGLSNTEEEVQTTGPETQGLSNTGEEDQNTSPETQGLSNTEEEVQTTGPETQGLSNTKKKDQNTSPETQGLSNTGEELQTTGPETEQLFFTEEEVPKTI